MFIERFRDWFKERRMRRGISWVHFMISQVEKITKDEEEQKRIVRQKLVPKVTKSRYGLAQNEVGVWFLNRKEFIDALELFTSSYKLFWQKEIATNNGKIVGQNLLKAARHAMQEGITLRKKRQTEEASKIFSFVARQTRLALNTHQDEEIQHEYSVAEQWLKVSNNPSRQKPSNVN